MERLRPQTTERPVVSRQMERRVFQADSLLAQRANDRVARSTGLASPGYELDLTLLNRDGGGVVSCSFPRAP